MELDFLYILSQIFIIINYILLAATYQLKNRRTVLIFNFATLISTGLSYFCLSAFAGVAMMIVALIRNIIFIIDENINGKSIAITKKDVFILTIIYILSIGAAIYTYSGFLSLMPALFTMLYTFSIWQKSTKVYKILGIPISFIRIVYNIYIFSFFGVLFETILLISATIGYMRETKKMISNKRDDFKYYYYTIETLPKSY